MSFSRARRRFLLAGALAGGGLLVGYGLSRPRELLGSAAVLPVGAGEVALNAWLKIATDGTVTIAVPRAEMGQGVHTALPMLVAEELDVPFAAVRVEQAPIDHVYGNVAVMMNNAPFDPDSDAWPARAARWSFARLGQALGLQITGGSTSVRDAWLPMRAAGYAARDMLVRAAAARLGVEAAALVTGDGRVRHEPSGRSLGYGKLAAEAARLDPPQTFRFRAPPATRYIGKPVPRLDVEAKTTGAAAFGIDTRAPDMLYAAIRISPVPGGRLKAIGRAGLADTDGVEAVVELDDAVAVVARSYWLAETTLDAAEIEFDAGEHAALDTAALYRAFERALDRDETRTYEALGDAETELAEVDAIHAEYRVPLLAHACMEPMNCTVRVDGDGAEIWCGNQAPDLLRLIAAGALGLPRHRVAIHTPLLGGGFGRRGEPDVMLRAIEVARALPGRTVQLIYSREQDLQHDTYRPPAIARFRARLGDDGRIHAWHNRLASPSVSRAVLGRAFPRLPVAGPDRTNAEGAAFLPYEVPHRKVEHAAVPIALPVGYWRSVGHSFNAFFTECFIDELAREAGADPLRFRLAHLRRHPRETRVLEVLRRVSQWDDPPAAGVARGVALHDSFGSVVGQVAEVAITGGRVRVHRVVCVIDCGVVVNPDIVIAQMQSGIVFGLSAALYGEVSLEHGRIVQRNFPDYRLVTMSDAPRIEVHVLEGRGEPAGVGETGTPPIAPAVANAVSALTGVAVRELPLGNQPPD